MFKVKVSIDNLNDMYIYNHLQACSSYSNDLLTTAESNKIIHRILLRHIWKAKIILVASRLKSQDKSMHATNCFLQYDNNYGDNSYHHETQKVQVVQVRTVVSNIHATTKQG